MSARFKFLWKVFYSFHFLIRNSHPAALQVTHNLTVSEIYVHGLVWVG